MSRDAQRGKLYTAEREVWDCGPKFDSIEAVWLFLFDRVRDRAWYKSAVARGELNGLLLTSGVFHLGGRGTVGFESMDKPFKLVVGRSNQSASWQGYSRTMRLPMWSWTPWVILHELAHGEEVADTRRVTPRQRKRELAGHGPAFCRAYLKLVRHVLGHEAEKQLKEAMKRNGVRWRKPRKLSPEQRLQLREAATQRLKPPTVTKGLVLIRIEGSRGHVKELLGARIWGLTKNDPYIRWNRGRYRVTQLREGEWETVITPDEWSSYRYGRGG